MVIGLRDADLHMAQLMPLPLTVSCFSKIQIGFTILVPAHPGSPGKRVVKRVCVCVSLMYVKKSQVSVKRKLVSVSLPHGVVPREPTLRHFCLVFCLAAAVVAPVVEGEDATALSTPLMKRMISSTSWSFSSVAVSGADVE